MLPIEQHITVTRKQLKPIDLGRQTAYHESVREYFKYYGLDLPGVDHHFGVLPAKQFKLATHVFIPKTCRAAVLLVHGYLEHSGYFRHALKRLVKEGYAVVLFDQPGHGLSSGSSANIRNFSLYGAVLGNVVQFAGKNLTKPLHLVAHSMGCSAAVEFLLNGGQHDVDGVVLAAPLVHSKLWGATHTAYKILVPLVRKVPRAFPFYSSDREFLLFTIFRDPLLRKEIPLHWVKSMFRWNERLDKYPWSPKKIRIIQGTSDLVVDGKYNVDYLQRKFPNASVYRIADANHQLFNEIPKYRTPTLNAIVRHLRGK